MLKAIRKGASVCYNQMQAHTRALHGSMASSLVLDSSKPPIVHVAEGLISQSASLSNDKQRTSSTAACKQAAQLLTQLSGARFQGGFIPCDCFFQPGGFVPCDLFARVYFSIFIQSFIQCQAERRPSQARAEFAHETEGNTVHKAAPNS